MNQWIKTLRRLAAAGLCLVLMGLAACAAGPADSGSADSSAASADSSVSAESATATAAKGRYVERKLPFPGSQNILTLNQVAQDTFYVLAGGSGAYEVWYSGDGGESWQQKQPAWLEGLDAPNMYSMTFTPEGNAYLSFYTEGEEDEPAMYTVYADENGLNEIEDIPVLKESNSGLALAPSGELLVDMYAELHSVNTETGKTNVYDAGNLIWMGAYKAYDKNLAICNGREIVQFDLETGARTGQIPLATEAEVGKRVIAVQPDRSGFFYCDADGLFRVTMDGALTEQLIDGNLVTFGMPSVYLMNLYVRGDGSFVVPVVQAEGGFELLHYTYDPEISRVPSTELSVFSLEESKSVRQAIGLFQSENPDVMVNLRVATSGEDAVTAADALRFLSTELLAGKGPDILVLDGMPLAGYVKQGALLDMRDLLREQLDSDLLPGVAGAFATDAGLFAVPTRFSLPVLVCEPGTKPFAGVAELLEWLAAQENPQMGVLPEELPNHFYDLGSVVWFRQDGTVDTSVLSKDLAAMKTYGETLAAATAEGPTVTTYRMPMFYGGRGITVMQNEINQLREVAAIYSAFAQREGELRLFPGEPAGVFIPRSILGINAAGGSREIAGQFVQFALSEKALIPFDDGLAANKRALEAEQNSMTAGEGLVGFSAVDKDTGEMYLLEVSWPQEAQMEQFFALVQGASVPVHSDAVIRQMVMGEIDGFLAGSVPLESAVNAITQKVERYRQEQQ